MSTTSMQVNRIFGLRGLGRQGTVFASGIALLATNLLGGSGGNEFQNGGSDSTIYNRFPTAFSPAPFTFAVWGPIFLGVIALIVYQALPTQRKNERLDKLSLPLVIAYLAIALTPFTPIGVGTLVLIVALLGFIGAFLSFAGTPHDRAFLWCVSIPITIFFAWITVATIVNTAQWLQSTGWNGFGLPSTTWAALLMFVATVIGASVTLRYRVPAYGMVLIWAFWGIVAAQSGSLLIVATALVATIALVACIVRVSGGQDMFPRKPVAALN